MANTPCIPVPSPQTIKKQLFPNGQLQPPALPSIWNAQVLLTPFGGLNNTKVEPSDQLSVGNVTYQAVSATEALMRVSMYLLESLHYYDFLFHTSKGVTNWWWMVSDPASPNDLPKKAFGPFGTTTSVPSQDFLAKNGFSHAGSWKVQRRMCDAFSASRGTVPDPDPSDPGGTIPNPASWLWFDAESGDLTRLINVDPENNFSLAVLGAYYIVDVPSLKKPSSTNLGDVYKVCTQQAGKSPTPPSAMVTLTDVLTAMAKPPNGAKQVSCTVSQIQALMPGIEQAPAKITPPSWTNRVNSECYMLGQDTFPYYCQLWYDWTVGTQVTVFVFQDEQGNYTTRSDEMLPKGSVGPSVTYEWSNSKWVPSCCTADGGDVPMPVPNFVEADNGRCRAAIKGNPYFGDMTIWSVMLGDVKSGWSDFWYSFNDQQQGIIFSLAPASSLTIIDYQTFVQNGNIEACVFDNPCGAIPACGPPAVVAQAKTKFVPA